MKTLNNLCTKSWYRFSKVLYVLVLIATVAIIYSGYRPQYDSFFADAIEPLFWVLFVLEIIKRSIYYTYFGTVFPVKVEFADYVSKIKNTITDFKNETSETPENTKRFISKVLDEAQLEIDRFEKKDTKKDYERLSKLNDLVAQVRHMYGVGKADFSLIQIYKVRALYYAQELGINADWVSIDL